MFRIPESVGEVNATTTIDFEAIVEIAIAVGTEEGATTEAMTVGVGDCAKMKEITRVNRMNLIAKVVQSER